MPYISWHGELEEFQLEELQLEVSTLIGDVDSDVINQNGNKQSIIDVPLRCNSTVTTVT